MAKKADPAGEQHARALDAETRAEHAERELAEVRQEREPVAWRLACADGKTHFEPVNHRRGLDKDLELAESWECGPHRVEPLYAQPPVQAQAARLQEALQSGAQAATASGDDDPDPELSRHPLPWAFEEYPGGSCIKDANGEWVMGGDSCEGYIDPAIGSFVCRAANIFASAPAPIDAVDARARKCPDCHVFDACGHCIEIYCDRHEAEADAAVASAPAPSPSSDEPVMQRVINELATRLNLTSSELNEICEKHQGGR